MNVNYDFSTEVAVITGAARGVGRAMVGGFAEAGCRVVAADRDLVGLAETCEPYGACVLAVQADVSSAEGAASIIDGAVQHFGKLSFCVNNAAVAPHTSLLEETVHVWDTVFAVNCRGTFLMTQLAGRAMIAQGQGGRIVNFSSGVSNRGSAGAAAYASSRAATESFSRVAAIELAPLRDPGELRQPRLDRYPAQAAAASNGRGAGPAYPRLAAGQGRRATGSSEPGDVAVLKRGQLRDRLGMSRRRGRWRRQPSRRRDHRRRHPLRLGHRPPAVVILTSPAGAPSASGKPAR